MSKIEEVRNINIKQTYVRSSLIIFGLLFKDHLEWSLFHWCREIDVESKIGMDCHIRDRL
jgi:hypothetical protein